VALTGAKMRLEPEFDTSKLKRAIRMIPIVLRDELDDAFDHIGRSFLSQFRKERLQGPPGIKSRGSHGIYKYFQRKKLAPTHDLMDMGVEIYSKSKIAAMHETGAVIRGEGSNRLAVPFSQEYKPEMYTAGGRLKTRFRKPGMLKKVRAAKLKGKYFLIQFKKGTDEIKPIFVLKHKITIKPRLGFLKTFSKHRIRRIQILNRAVVKALKKV